MGYVHWRTFMNSNYLRAELIEPGKDLIVTIKEVKPEEIVGNNGKKDRKPVAHFVEDVLPMVLNATNCKVIEKLFGTANPNEWAGKKIQIFSTKTKASGESIPCLRIKNVYVETNEKAEEKVFKCCVCGADIDVKTYNGSMAKYGKPYCSKSCLDADVNGKDLLQ